MIALALIVSAALAADPPPRPRRPQAFAQECREAIAVKVGDPIGAIDVDALATCSGVLLPTSELHYLLALESWGDEVKAWHDLECAALALQLGRSQAATRRARRSAWVVSGAAVIALGSASAALYVAGDL